MIPSETKQSFDTDGFVVVRQFLPPSELADLKHELDRYISDVVPTLADSFAFYEDRARPETLKQMQHMGVDPYFEAYRRNPRWKALAELLIGEPAEAEQPAWFNKPPGTEHPTPPHQDNYYFCLRPSHVVNAWLALETVDDENGCLHYVRGSHTRGIRPHSPTKVLGFSQGIVDFGDGDRVQEASIHLAPGDLVAHHGETIHRADPNRSTTRGRPAFAMVWRGESCQLDDEAFERYQSAAKSQHQEFGLTV